MRELFQFDCAELDFGIYRILNHKRDVVEQFINERLPAIVDAKLDSGLSAQQERADAELANAGAKTSERTLQRMQLTAKIT